MSTTTSLNVLIAGGGVSGQALALVLSRDGHRVRIAERAPDLRASGAQVDLRGQGIEAVRRTGLLEAVREVRVHESGVAFVDSRGRRRGVVMANTSGRGRQSLTSELEVLRGDLVRLLDQAVRSGGGEVEHRYGAAVVDVEQGGGAGPVVAHLSDGTSSEHDLVVAADGQGSRLRPLVLAAAGGGGARPVDPYRRLGIHMAYWSLPRAGVDGELRDAYSAHRGRLVWRRSPTASTSQAYYVLRETSAEASAVHRGSREHQQHFWAERFADAGWQTERFSEAMASSPDFYSQEALQVRIPTWSSGRVVLTGDAAHCASPFSGMGVSAALVGAQVLAGALREHSRDVPTALAAYERTLRPFVDRVQASVRPRLLRAGMPASRAGVAGLRLAISAATAAHLPELLAHRAGSERDGDWELPAHLHATAA